MDEKSSLELIEELQMLRVPSDDAIERLDEIQQVVIWAEQQKRWDILITITQIIADHIVDTRPIMTMYGMQNADKTIETAGELWNTGVDFALKGRMAAKESDNQRQEIQFLDTLSRLSRNLGDFAAAKDYTESRLLLTTTPEAKEHIASDFFYLGHEAREQENFSVARICYQNSFDIFQDLKSEYAMANILAFMAVNEEMDSNYDLAKTYMERSVELKKQFENT